MKPKTEKSARPEVNRKLYDSVMKYGLELTLDKKLLFPRFEQVVEYLMKVKQ